MVNDLARQSVCFVVPVLTHYRVGFHRLVREKLAQNGIEYRLIYSAPVGDAAKKLDTVELDWAEKVALFDLSVFGHKAFWQCCVAATRGCDLVILAQENSQLANYPIQIRGAVSRSKVAFFGHGKNFQSTVPEGLRERWKSFWANKVDWWFTYTQGTAGVVAKTGFPIERITVFNNTIDVSQILQHRAVQNPKRQAQLRGNVTFGSNNVGLYVGGIYAEKRIRFLLLAAQKIKNHLPDFHLIVIGDGPQAHLIKDAARDCDWIHVAGAKFGAEKSELASLARIMLMPGLVGLGVLDSFAYETPIITTDIPFHSPEIEYLIDGQNGLILPGASDARAYALTAVNLLTDEVSRQRLVRGGREKLAELTIENMATRFSAGVLGALKKGAPVPRRMNDAQRAEGQNPQPYPGSDIDQR